MSIGRLASTASYATANSPTFTGTVSWAGATLPASTATVDTNQSTTSTSFTDLATSGPAVTVTTGTKALVTITARLYHSTGGSAAAMGFAVSSATTVAPSIENSLINNDQGRMSVSRLITGLTAGSNIFTAKYESQDAGTSNFQYRQISVIDMGS